MIHTGHLIYLHSGFHDRVPYAIGAGGESAFCVHVSAVGIAGPRLQAQLFAQSGQAVHEELRVHRALAQLLRTKGWL